MRNLKDLIMLVKKELIICVAVPILTAVLFNSNILFNTSIFLFISVGLSCAFAYGIVKMIFTLKKHDVVLNEAGINQKSAGYQVFIWITAVIMPFVGLLINNFNEIGIFGDFSNMWFYIIAVLNGLLMLVDVKENRLGIMLFYLKIVGFTYIAYFAIIFMPILPLGFVGLIFYGLGAFIFVPITVFITEMFQILRDVRKLKMKFRKGLIIAAIAGVLTIPAILTVNFSASKMNFKNALTYLSADSSEMPNVNIPRLKKTLSHIESVLEARQEGWDIFNAGTNIPVISKFYQIIALDDRILSLDTTQLLSKIFLGIDNGEPINSDSGQFENVNLIGADVNTTFDEKAGVYKTWVDLEIKNEGDEFLAEYKTDFLLPDGCFIKDYYLYVGTERKQGILADKRAALITYNNIIRTPKDPGIIYYKSDNVIELRVYPFNAAEVRKTGFLIWHAQNETITIDNTEINLAAKDGVSKPMDMQGITFIPASYKENLSLSERAPKYYFVVDASKNSPYEDHLKRVQDYVNYSEIMNARVYAASYKVYDDASVVKCEGGFNLPLAMEMIFNEFEKNSLWFPVIIAVSDNICKAPEFKKENMARQFPESEYYYNLGYDLSLTPYSFQDNKRHDIITAPIISTALDYNGFIVADNDKSEIVISGGFGNYTDNEYQNAFLLRGKSSLSGNNSGAQAQLVRDSFRQRVLTKYTAFTVLETKEQERALLELQNEFLANDEKGAPAVMMDEPGLLLCLILAFFLIICGKKKFLAK